jgi:alanyl-tRNA synthetase
MWNFFFLQIYPDPVRVVSVGHKVEDLLANPESEEWLSISTELCGGLFAILHYAL